jgi:hypothetical protein
MTYALIDNATLTAVQRVMGDIIILNTDTINGDLVAFENFIQAILFYDDLICIDNYKEEYREDRIKQFDFIRFISESDFDFSKIDEHAKAEANSIRPEIRGGEFVDQDFQEFFSLLNMNMICTWDMTSSVYYLTMKMLGQPNTEEWSKYGALSSSIFNELSDAAQTHGRWSKEVKLIGSDGTIHTKERMAEERQKQNRGLGGTTKSLDMFVASLNWLGYKSIYYSLAAKYFKADSFLHPIRHSFQLHWMKKTGAYGHDFTSKLVGSLSTNLQTTVSEIVDYGRSSTVHLDIPIFSAWLLQQSGSPRNIIEAALELKKSDDMQNIRGLLNQIRIAYDDDGLGAANKNIAKWEAELIKASASVKATYGIKTAQGIPSSSIMNVYNSFAAFASLPSFPTFDFNVPLPNFVRSNTSSSFSNVYKSISKELTTIERLGGIRDELSSSFSIDRQAYKLGVKTESPRFRNVSSEWKIPM